MSLSLNENSPLAKAQALTVSDIAEEDIIGFPKPARPILHDVMWNSFRAESIQPRITSEVIDKSTLMQFVVQNLGIGLAPHWVENISPGGLAFIPFMPGEVSIDMYIAYRKKGNSPTTNEFIVVSKEVALDMAGLRE